MLLKHTLVILKEGKKVQRQRGLRTEEVIIKAFDILDFISRLNLASYHHGRTNGALKVIL